jgi:hypothetical protein
MLPNREGRFKAQVLEHGVDETGPNRLATFVCKFGLTEELSGGQWLPLPPEDGDLDITGYFYMEKKDGSINTVTVDSLKAAFGWDGRDPLWLQDADFGGLVVQLKLEFEVYDNKQRLKVRWVDAEDAGGRGVPKADDNARRALGTRLGSKLRALAGGSPAPAPRPKGMPTPPGTAAPPAAAKAARPAPSSATGPAAATAATPAKTATMQQAWEAFARECPKGWQTADVEQEWFRVLGDLLPGKQPDAISPAEWVMVIEEAPAKIIPM